VGSTLALVHPLYYDRLVQLASTIKFVHQQVIATNMASKGQECGLKVKILPKCVRPHLVRSTALGAFELTHGRTQHPRSHAEPTVARITQPALAKRKCSAVERTPMSALAATAVICGRTCTLRSTTNNWCVRTQVVRSNALQ
jgi:hypothetical protein